MQATRDRHAQRQLRLRLRQSYGCDCAGPVVGRVAPKMTNGIMATVEHWTGDKPRSCPWRAFYQPFVRRVLSAYRFFESGQLDWAEPEPSARLVAGVTHYHMAVGRARTEQLASERARGGASPGSMRG